MTSRFADQQRDNDRLRKRLDATDRQQRRAAGDDVVIEHPRRLFLRSPNGTYFAFGVSDDGTLTATNMGPNPL